MNNIEEMNRESCIGCGACIEACSAYAITLNEDKAGFLFPKVNNEKCVTCQNCLSVCPIGKESSSSVFGTYGFYLNTDELRDCASGGVATAFAKKVLGDGGCVYGVEYMNNYRDIGFCKITESFELSRMQSSKYSETLPPPYNEIERDLDDKKSVLFIGLPCQIAALKTFLGRKQYPNLLTVGLICFGKSSLKLYRHFINKLIEEYNSDIQYINMRWKRKDWNVSWLKVVFANKKVFQEIMSSNSYGLLMHEILRPSCYECQYKINNAFEDILIGDFWGSEYLDSKKRNKMGLSVVFTFSENANLFVKDVDGSFFEIDKEDALKTNGAIFKSSIRPKYYEDIIRMIDKGNSLNDVCREIYGKHKMIVLKLKFFIKYLMPNSLICYIKKKRSKED